LTEECHVNFDLEGRRKNSHWGQDNCHGGGDQGKANPPWDRGAGWPFGSAGKAGGKSKGIKEHRRVGQGETPGAPAGRRPLYPSPCL